MLFCCLWRNVETSCHKHFLVISSHQQALPLTTTGKCHNLPRAGVAVFITPSRSQRWQQSIDSQIFDQNRDFCIPHLHSTPPLGGFPSLLCRLQEKKLEWRGYLTLKKFWYVYSFWHDPWTWQTHRQTDGQTDTAWRHRPRLHSIARQKNV